MDIVVDYRKLRRICDGAVERYRNNQYPYDLPEARLPQDDRHLPPGLERGSVAHAMYFFSLCLYMRGGISSVYAAQRLGVLYARRPEFFDTAYAAAADYHDLQDALVGVELHYMKNIATRYWIENADRLLEWYDGDPQENLRRR